MSPKKKKIITVVCVLIYLVICGLVIAYIGTPFIKFVDEPEKFQNWIEERGFAGQAVFFMMVVLQVLVAVMPGEPLEIAAGYAFGGVGGTILCLAGIAVGEFIVFLFVRKFGIRAVELFISSDKIISVKFLRDTAQLERLMFILFLIPGTPKDLLTYCAGLTKIKLADFLIITTIARIPSVVSSTLGGSALGDGNYMRALIVFAVTAGLSTVGLLVYSKIKRKNLRGYF